MHFSKENFGAILMFSLGNDIYIKQNFFKNFKILDIVK